ncbi:MAG: four helix bundle protein [Chthonomonas sp.]|nr:four helix bundle protein [Chthonomonas sp.]
MEYQPKGKWHHFRDLEVWKLSRALVPDIYIFTAQLPAKDGFAYPEQLRRAVLSISLNIAEGHGRRTEKYFAQFLRTSLGSLNEVEALLILGVELGYLSGDEMGAYEARIRNLAVKLSNFISALNSNVVRETAAEYEPD